MNRKFHIKKVYKTIYEYVYEDIEQYLQQNIEGDIEEDLVYTVYVHKNIEGPYFRYERNPKVYGVRDYYTGKYGNVWYGANQNALYYCNSLGKRGCIIRRNYNFYGDGHEFGYSGGGNKNLRSPLYPPKYPAKKQYKEKDEYQECAANYRNYGQYRQNQQSQKNEQQKKNTDDHAFGGSNYEGAMTFKLSIYLKKWFGLFLDSFKILHELGPQHYGIIYGTGLILLLWIICYYYNAFVVDKQNKFYYPISLKKLILFIMFNFFMNLAFNLYYLNYPETALGTIILKCPVVVSLVLCFVFLIGLICVYAVYKFDKNKIIYL